MLIEVILVYFHNTSSKLLLICNTPQIFQMKHECNDSLINDNHANTPLYYHFYTTVVKVQEFPTLCFRTSLETT